MDFQLPGLTKCEALLLHFHRDPRQCHEAIRESLLKSSLSRHLQVPCRSTGRTRALNKSPCRTGNKNNTRYIDDRCIMMHLENLDFKNISIKPSTSINTHLGNRRIWHLPHSPLWRPAGGWKADLDIRDVDAKHPWGTQQTGDMNWLVVCLPPEKIWKSDWIIIPTLGENKTCSKPPASEWWNMTNRHWIQVWRKQTPGFWRIHLRFRLNLYPVLSVITEIAG